MSPQWIKLTDVINFLKDSSRYPSQLEKLEKIPYRQPGHGSCCTCQTCGHHYDDCVCDHNATIDWINSLEKFECEEEIY